MAFTPTYGSIFPYGAGHLPDKVRLSGPAPSSPGADVRWYGDTPDTDGNGTAYGGGDYGDDVTIWEDTSTGGSHAGYPASLATPNKSWQYGTALPDGTYTRVIRERLTKMTFEEPA